MTAVGLLVGLGLAAAVGLAAAAPPLRGRPGGGVLAAAAALPLGLGATSVTFFLWRLAGGASTASLAAVEVSLLAALVILGRFAPSPSSEPLPAEETPAIGRISLALGAAAAAAAVTAVAVRMAFVPHGEWDAWALWSTKAHFLEHAGPAWRGLLDPETTHPDYPAMLPSALARLWVYAPGGGTLVPALVAGCFAFSVVAVPAAVLLALRGPLAAGLCALLVAGTTDVLRYAAHQYADVPLASLLALGIGLLLLTSGRPGPGPAALGGAALGLAAWTKNEGILMLAAAAVAWLASHARTGPARLARSAAAFGAGAAAGLAALVPLKALVGPSSGWALGVSRSEMLARMAEPDRYAVIASAGLRKLLALGAVLPALAVAVALLGWRTLPRPRPAWAFLGLALVVAGEFAVYLITPWPLEWQIATSMDRLVVQLWPTACVLALLAARTPGRTSAAGPP